MFQNAVNSQPAPAVQGDFASGNPRASVLTPGGGAYVAGASGVNVGVFAWANPATNLASNTGGVGALGFVHRDQQALITTFLAESGVQIPQGFGVSLMNGGDFWGKFAGGAARGQKVFANYADGTAVAGTAGSPPTGGVVTGVIGGTAATSIIGVTGTASVGATCTGSISGTVLTVASAVVGVFHVGDVLSGPGCSSDPVTAGTTIVSLGTGTGGAGTYNVSVSQTSTSATITAVSTIADITALTAGTVAVGQVLTESGMAVGSTITAQLTGTAGSTGTYSISGAAQLVASATFTAPSNNLKAGTVTGVLHVGQVLSGTGVTTGTTITAQLTGTAGATGNYTVSIPQYTASTTVTATGTILDVTAVTSGTIGAGDPISGSGITTGTTITGQVSGTPGGIGVYTVSIAQQAASETITALGAAETGFYVATACGAGELAKISTWGY